MILTQFVVPGDARDLVYDLVDGSVNCVIADPPYGVNFVSYMATAGKRKRPGAEKYAHKIEGDDDVERAIAICDEVMQPLIAEKMVPDGDIYIFTSWTVLPQWDRLVRSWAHLGVKYQMLLVWEKGYPGLGDIDGSWGCGHELILYCKKGRREVPFRRSGVIHVDRLGPGQNVHPTEKPVALIERLIDMSTTYGDIVVDPFAGSGSTLIAAKRLGRSAIGFESNMDYVNIINQRLGQEYLF